MKTTGFLVLLWLVSLPAASQVLRGTVTSEGEPVSFATIRIVHTALGTAADVNGSYRLVFSRHGTYEVAISAVGFASQTHIVTLAARDTVRLDVSLAVSTYESSTLVITGTLEEVDQRESPVKVDVVPPRFLQSTPSANVMDALARVNGLYQKIDCGVCYTNNIRINGVDGPNTAVLIDGMPVMSSLAAIYGLNGISPILIRQIEIIKGPMSTLYGSEALGGVINILTKNPANAPGLSVNAFSTTYAEAAVELAAVPFRGRTDAMVSGTLYSAAHYRDLNGDGFSDRPLTTRIALFAKSNRRDRYGMVRGSLAAKAYYERRDAGTRAFLRDPERLRGSDEIYGESILSRRAEVLATYSLRPDVELRGSAAFHEQNSYYGETGYFATQADAFTQVAWTPMAPALHGHSPLIGFAIRAVRYDDDAEATGDYDDNGRLIVNRPHTRFIPGLFVQDDWQVSHHLRLLLGMRGDYQSHHGIIASPRAALKWQPGERTTLRFNAGTGFRAVNLFTEEHAAYTGGRATLVLEDLRPERSVSTTASIRQIIGARSPVIIDADAFWTRFSNKIEPDYSIPGQIRYQNLVGSATTRGVSISAQGSIGRGLRYSAGATLLDVYVSEEGARHPLEFAPDFQGTATATWEAPRGIVVDYSVQLHGPMALPYYEPSVREAYRNATGSPLHSVSPTYLVHTIQVSKMLTFGSQLLHVYGAIENAFGYRQSSPIVGYYDGTPGFGPSFDTAYVYGPIEGRHYGIGMRLTRRK